MPENIAEKNHENSASPELENSTGETSVLSTMDQIRLAPSVELWKAELNSILEKLRDDDIARLGDVSLHIKVLIRGSKSPELARQTFWTALNDLLQQWQPLMRESPERLYYILSLIAGFTPSIGFVKLAGYLKNGSRFPGTYDTPIGRTINFQSLALHALKACYPTAPPSASEDSAYQTYLDILRLNFERPDYFGSCAARLIDLKELSYNSPEILDGITRHPEGLKEIIRLLLNPVNPATIRENIRSLYVHCKKNKLDTFFKDFVKPYGRLIEQPTMQVEHKERTDYHQHPSVYLFYVNNTTLEISLSYEDIYELNKPTDADMAKLRQLINEYHSVSPHFKDGYVSAIGEEVSAIIEKCITYQQFRITDVQEKLKLLGGKLSTDSEGKHYTFILDGKNIRLKLTDSSYLEVWGGMTAAVNKSSFQQLIQGH